MLTMRKPTGWWPNLPASKHNFVCLTNHPGIHPWAIIIKMLSGRPGKNSQNCTDNSPNGVLMLQLFFSMLDSRGNPKVTCPFFSGNSRCPTPPHQNKASWVRITMALSCLLSSSQSSFWCTSIQKSLPMLNFEIQRHHFFPPFTHGSAAKTIQDGSTVKKRQQFDQIIYFFE